MKQLTDEQKKVIQDMGELFFTPEEICKNLELDFDTWYPEFEVPESPAFKAYETGWLKGDITLRKSISSAASNGSSPAQTMLKQIQDKAAAKRVR